ncbi:hypothetical protein PQR75_46895 [Paraburkholderia fungorum]|uniref:hypothetical protein n=1 Tax=Paraburkholderia fungorum TaxID=134537 RepID=UPI0038B6E981
MNQTTYEQSRQQLLRRAATGESIGKELDRLEAEQADAEKAASRAAEVAGAADKIAREEAQKRLQQTYDDAVVVFRELQGKATDAAAHVEALVAQARAALEAWQQAQQAATAQASTVHHLASQGARPVMMPVAFGGADYSVHLLRHAGVQYHQQILYTGLLPRII